MPIPGAVPASMAKRLLAHAIDSAASLVLGGAFVAAGTLSLLRALQEGAADLAPVGVLAVGYALLLGFGVFQWWYQGSRGFTVGKRATGLRTLSAETGRPAGMARILVRMLVVAAGALVLGLGQIVVLVSPLIDRTGRRQGWHDKAAGTVVLDIGVGLDPMTATPADPRAAARRLEGLLGQGARSTPTAVLARAARFTTPSSGTAVATAPTSGTSVAAPSSARTAAAGAPPVTAAAPTRNPPTPTTDPVAGEPGPGIITSVPLPRRSGQASTSGQPSIPAQRPTSGQPPNTAPALSDDVEMTRLRPARGKVPELPGSAPCATVELTDGRRIVLAGPALIGRAPAPRQGEDGVTLITIADPRRSVSKTHLAVGVDRQGVWVRDRDSTNGTVVTLADGQQILCAAEQQVRLPAGACAAFGDYGLTVVGP